MTLQTVCSGWMTDLCNGNVTGLTDAIQHLYTPWSVEDGYASSGERHIAIWPEAEAESATPLTAGSPPSYLATQSFVIRVWEDASVDSSRLQDDETAASAWLTLAQAIRDRLMVWANIQTGSVNTTQYGHTTFDFRAEARIFEIRFLTTTTLTYS